jgi:aminoglycoside phosphotransferase (APT) family kinase protein
VSDGPRGSDDTPSGTPGTLIARGRSADVYDHGEGLVLRRYRMAHLTAEPEARIMEHARAQGYPVPEVIDARGGDLVMRRVEGPTMLDDLGRRPWRLVAHARLLADLHRRLHRIRAPDDVPRSFGGGDTLLHLDLHPENVLLTPRGPVVTDWTNAAAGPPAADEAQTWVILATSRIPASGFRARLLGSGRRLFLDALLRELDGPELRAQLPVVAAARREDPNIHPEEVEAIDRLLLRTGAGTP